LQTKKKKRKSQNHNLYQRKLYQLGKHCHHPPHNLQNHNLQKQTRQRRKKKGGDEEDQQNAGDDDDFLTPSQSLAKKKAEESVKKPPPKATSPPASSASASSSAAGGAKPKAKYLPPALRNKLAQKQPEPEYDEEEEEPEPPPRKGRGSAPAPARAAESPQKKAAKPEPEPPKKKAIDSELRPELKGVEVSFAISTTKKPPGAGLSDISIGSDKDVDVFAEDIVKKFAIYKNKPRMIRFLNSLTKAFSNELSSDDYNNFRQYVSLLITQKKKDEQSKKRDPSALKGDFGKKVSAKVSARDYDDDGGDDVVADGEEDFM
jgi:hypothetical protein